LPFQGVVLEAVGIERVVDTKKIKQVKRKNI
jgi:hypothetical protein